MRRNSFGHWTTGMKREEECIVCGDWRYEDLCKDCKRPRYITVENAKQASEVSREGYVVINYQMSTSTKTVPGGDEVVVTERYLLELKLAPTPELTDQEGD